MSGLLFLIPIALFMGGLGLVSFLWAVRSGQFDDPDGAAARILISPDEPLPERKLSEQRRRPERAGRGRFLGFLL